MNNNIIKYCIVLSILFILLAIILFDDISLWFLGMSIVVIGSIFLYFINRKK